MKRHKISERGRGVIVLIDGHDHEMEMLVLIDGHGSIHDLFNYLEATMTVNKAHPRVEHGPCSNCGIPTDITLLSLCDVCATMLRAVSRPWFETAHKEWANENKRRIANKQRMVGGDQKEAV